MCRRHLSTQIHPLRQISRSLTRLLRSLTTQRTSLCRFWNQIWCKNHPARYALAASSVAQNCASPERHSMKSGGAWIIRPPKLGCLLSRWITQPRRNHLHLRLVSPAQTCALLHPQRIACYVARLTCGAQPKRRSSKATNLDLKTSVAKVAFASLRHSTNRWLTAN